VANPPPDELDFGQTVRGLSVGQKLFGRYTLKTVLGRGGMGIVWHAFDEDLEREVALKFLPELVVHDPSLVEDLKRETRQSLELTHPHIVRIYDFVQDAQSACISMEFVDGDTLSNLRLEKPHKVFEVQELEEYVRQLCDALQYAHSRAQIVHRDLKPANLMLNKKGDLKVTDFGISRSLADSVSMMTMGRGISGTLPYMSPQQLDGERTSPLDDVYSLGVTCYELLTTRPPFFRGDIGRQVHEKIPPPISVRREELGVASTAPVSAEWEQTIAACLAKDPALRPQTATEVLLRLRGVAPLLSVEKKDFPPPLIQSGPRETASRPPNKRRAALIAVSAAGLVLLLGAVAYFGQNKSGGVDRPVKTQTPAGLIPFVQIASSSPSPARMPATRFSDSFADNRIDVAKWTVTGHTVTETGQVMRVLTTVTDQPGTAVTRPFSISSTGLITITRRVFLHHDDSISFKGKNHFFLGQLALQFGAMPMVRIEYDDYDYAGATDVPAHGFFVTRNDKRAHNPSSSSDVSAGTPAIWDTWFNEKITYDPGSGALQYFVNDSPQISFNVGSLPNSAAPTMTMTFRAYGWWTGHQQLFGDLLVTQL
jgi:serine/threonine protein kinase